LALHHLGQPVVAAEVAADIRSDLVLAGLGEPGARRAALTRIAVILPRGSSGDVQRERPVGNAAMTVINVGLSWFAVDWRIPASGDPPPLAAAPGR